MQGEPNSRARSRFGETLNAAAATRIFVRGSTEMQFPK